MNCTIYLVAVLWLVGTLGIQANPVPAEDNGSGEEDEELPQAYTESDNCSTLEQILEEVVKKPKAPKDKEEKEKKEKKDEDSEDYEPIHQIGKR